MSVEIRVPQLPESVADATLVAWRKQVGQSVGRDENLADLETDKVMLEVPAPVSGVLRDIQVVDGTSVKSGELLAIIEESDAAAPKSDAAAPKSGAAGPTGPAARRVIEQSALPADAVSGTAPRGRVTKADAVQAAAAAAPAKAPATKAPEPKPAAPAEPGD